MNIYDLFRINMLFVPNIAYRVFISYEFLIFIICWSILGFFLLKNVFKNIQKYKNLDDKTKEKYKDFIRNDWHHWSFFKLYFGFICFSWMKLLCIGLTVFVTWLLLKIYTFNIKDLNKIDDNLRKKINSISNYGGLMFSLSSGVYTKQKKIDVNYEEYLGKNYKELKNPNKNDHAAVIVNHVSWLDILILMNCIGSGFIASIAVSKFPFIGTICSCIGSIYVNRESKEERNMSLNVVEEKLTSIYDKKVNSGLIIFPEGTTTNGTCLLPFKKGAFSKLYPVKPYILKIDPVNHISLAMDIIEMTTHLLIIVCCPYYIVELIEYPIFSPNDYFKNEYSKQFPNKQLWEIYAETIRKIMISKSNLREGTLSYLDKRALLDSIRNIKKIE